MTFHREPLGLKQPPVISDAIRNSADGQSCTMRSDWCAGGTETTVFCHAPIRRFGLGGIGMKVPDIFGYHGCRRCHAHESDMGWDDIFRAVTETQMRLLRAGIIAVKP